MLIRNKSALMMNWQLIFGLLAGAVATVSLLYVLSVFIDFQYSDQEVSEFTRFSFDEFAKTIQSCASEGVVGKCVLCEEIVLDLQGQGVIEITSSEENSKIDFTIEGENYEGIAPYFIELPFSEPAKVISTTGLYSIYVQDNKFYVEKSDLIKKERQHPFCTQDIQGIEGISPYSEFKGSTADKIDTYNSFILAASQKYGVPVNLIKAVIYQESRGNPIAASPKGAVGLMQLIPGTAEQMGLKTSNPDERLNPGRNIDGGTKYLDFLCSNFLSVSDYHNDCYSSDLAPLLAMYNAGPNNTRVRFCEERSQIIINGAAKSIIDKTKCRYVVPPFEETQKYVESVPSILVSFDQRDQEINKGTLIGG